MNWRYCIQYFLLLENALFTFLNFLFFNLVNLEGHMKIFISHLSVIILLLFILLWLLLFLIYLFCKLFLFIHFILILIFNNLWLIILEKNCLFFLFILIHLFWSCFFNFLFIAAILWIFILIIISFMDLFHLLLLFLRNCSSIQNIYLILHFCENERSIFIIKTSHLWMHLSKYTFSFFQQRAELFISLWELHRFYHN